MSRPQQHALATLVAAVRRRLWLQAMTRLVHRGMWAGSATVLVCGLVHYSLHALSLQLAFTLALLPPLAALVTALLFQRPGPDKAASTVDRWFDGKALITTAWELQSLAPVPVTGGGKLVLQRAERAARDWRPRLHREHALQLPRYTGLALVPASIGVFLLVLPGVHGSGEPASAYPGSRSAAHQPAGPTLSTPATKVVHPAEPGALTRAEQDGGEFQPAPIERAAAQAAGPLEVSEPSGAAGKTPRDKTGLPAFKLTQSRTPTATTTATASVESTEAPADRSPGSQAAQQGATADAGPVPGQTFHLVDLARTPGDGQRQARGATTVDLAETRAALLETTGLPQAGATAHAAGVPYRASYPPALRVYVSNYFTELARQP